jgi:signal transduction histidine kinase
MAKQYATPRAGTSAAKRKPKPAALPDPHRRLIRMSLDLHDGPMQDLVAVGFALERLRHDLSDAPDGERFLVQVDDVREQLVMVERALRAMAEARADEAQQTTLAALVDQEIARFCRLGSVDVELDVDSTLETDTDSQRIALHRVLREALSNVARHAQAGNVSIRLYETDDVIYLEVADDGIGFDTRPGKRKSGIGLRGMRDRLRLLGGSLKVESAPGGPTRITAAVNRWHD